MLRLYPLLCLFLLQPFVVSGQQTQTRAQAETQTQRAPQTTQSQPQSQIATTPVKVTGTANLRDPLIELGKFFEKFNPAFHVDVDILQSSEILDQVNTRAPLDVVVGLSKKELDELEAKKLILPGSRSKIVSNEAVIVAAPDSTMEIKEPKDLVPADLKQVALLKGSGGLAKASKDYLTKLGLMSSLSGKTVDIKNIHEGFQKLKAGQAQWMFAYSSDATDSKKSKVIWHIPQSEIPADEYYAAIPASSKQPEAGKKFIEALHSTIAGMILKNQGYIVPETQPQTRPAASLKQPQTTQTRPARLKQAQTQTQPKHGKHEHKKKKKQKKPPSE